MIYIVSAIAIVALIVAVLAYREAKSKSNLSVSEKGGEFVIKDGRENIILEITKKI